MRTHIAKSTHSIQNLLAAEEYCGILHDEELPQVAGQEILINELVHDVTGKSIELIDLERHHQTDASYQ